MVLIPAELGKWIYDHLPPCTFTRKGNVVTCHVKVKAGPKIKGLEEDRG